jgi:hypothetical protein
MWEKRTLMSDHRGQHRSKYGLNVNPRRGIPRTRVNTRASNWMNPFASIVAQVKNIMLILTVFWQWTWNFPTNRRWKKIPFKDRDVIKKKTCTKKSDLSSSSDRSVRIRNFYGIREAKSIMHPKSKSITNGHLAWKKREAFYSVQQQLHWHDK